jgi:hypothetical protein
MAGISRRSLLLRSALVGGVPVAGAALMPARASADTPPTQSKIVTNVKDYGATGDGTTDDAAAINAAIAATGNGGAVWFPSGTYIVGSTIQLRQGLRYIGSSDFGAAIHQADGANLVAVVADRGWLNNSSTVSDGVTIENLKIEGNRKHNHRGHGLVLMTWRSLLSNVVVNNAPQSGIVFADQTIGGKQFDGTAVENRIENCSMGFCGQYGFWVQDHNFSGVITDGYFLNNVVESNQGEYGVRIDRAAGWFIENNHVYDSKQNAFRLNQVWCTYFAFNEVDTFGLARKRVPYAGFRFDWLLADGRPSVIIGNMSSTAAQHAKHSEFFHFDIAGNRPGTARATLVANVAHNDAQLDLGSGHHKHTANVHNAIGFRFQAFPRGELHVTDVGNSVSGIARARHVASGHVKFTHHSASHTVVADRGDLLVGTGPEGVERLPLGDDGDVLVVDRSAPHGVRWAKP